MKRLKILMPILVTLALVASLFGMALPVAAAQVDAAKTVIDVPNIFHVGDTIHYQMVLTNPAGNAATNTFTDIHDHDPSGITFYFVGGDSGVPSLVQAPGESDTFFYDYVILEADLVPVPLGTGVTNLFHATGTDSLGDFVNAEVSANSLVISPAIDVIKLVEPAVSKEGDEVIYTIEVINTGDTDLDQVSVIDSVLGDISASFPATLAAGASSGPINFPYTIQPGDPDPLLNEVEAIYEDVLGLAVSDVDTAEVNLFQPSITIDKTADTELSKAGDTINYTITVTNTSSADTPNLIGTVVDPILGLNEAINLAPGGVSVFNVPYIVQPGDADPLVNTATVTVSPEGFTNVFEDSDSWTVDLVNPAITLVKDCEPSSGAVGDVITYTITITNTGDVALENIVVTDSLLGDLSASFVDTLAPAAWDTQQFTRAILAGDPDPLVNTATVTAKVVGLPNTLEASDDCSVDITGGEGLTPGFWKNHPDAWEVYSPNQTLESVFDVPDSLGLDDKTLMEALNFKGGPGVLGAAQILLRAAVAALLNSSSSEVDYPLSTAQVIAQVNAALASLDRDTMLTLASQLDAFNNLGTS